MRLKQAIEILRQNTLACYWPNAEMGRLGTDFDGIFSEVKQSLQDIKMRQGIEPNAAFFVLDDTDPETEMYNDLMLAICTVRNCRPCQG